VPTPALVLPLREHGSGPCGERLGELAPAGRGQMSAHRAGPRRAGEAVSREATLDAAVSRAWDGLAAHREVACVVCGGSMEPRYGAGALPVAGRCVDCGSELS
jgi:hypothetical protein